MKRFVSFLVAVVLCFSSVFFSASADIGIYNEYSTYEGWGVVSSYKSDTHTLDTSNVLDSQDVFLCPRAGYFTPVFRSTWNGTGTDKLGFSASYVLEDVVLESSCYWYIAIGCFCSSSTPEVLNMPDTSNILLDAFHSSSGEWQRQGLLASQTWKYSWNDYCPQYSGEYFLIKASIPAAPENDRFMALSIGCSEWVWQYDYRPGSQWGYFVPCSFLVFEDDYSDSIVDILDHIASIDSNLITYLPNIYSSLQSIVSQLQALNTDTDTIISLLNQMISWDKFIWTELDNISNSVDAIYFVLTEELKDESAELSSAASDAVSQLENEEQATAYYQTNMQSSYESLALGDMSFGSFTSGIELVGRIFSDIWDAFGVASIIFTFPLTLGIALLVIGRISKSHSSSNSGKGDSEDA